MHYNNIEINDGIKEVEVHMRVEELIPHWCLHGIRPLSSNGYVQSPGV